MVECNVDIGEKGYNYVKLIFPAFALESWDELVNKLAKKRVVQVYVKLGYPRKPISKGERGQMNRIHGQCHDIAIQLSVGGKEYTTDDVKEAMKRMSVGIGYRTEMNDIDGVEQPISLADATMEEAGFVTTTINRFADAHNLWLTEYDESTNPPTPYRSLHGRTRAEMNRLKDM